MIQRIQSVYLLLVFVFAILFAVLPMAYFTVEAMGMSLRLLYFRSFFEEPAFSSSWHLILLTIIWAVIMLVTVITTFQYKNRLLQIKMGKLNILLHVALIMLVFFFIDALRGQVIGAEFSYGAGVLLPVISLIFILMAIKAIKKDEALVRSADRFR